MTWTDFDTTQFNDGDVLTEANITTYIGDNFMSLPHRWALDNLDRDVASTTNELSIWSTTAGGFVVTANKLGTNGSLEVELRGDYLFNNNTANTLTIRVKFGGAAVLTAWAAAPGSTLSATRWPWFLNVLIANRGATNSQIVSVAGGTQFNTASAPGFNSLSAATATAAVDTTVNQTFDITAQWSAASANNSWKKVWARAMLARN
jgi:hypothetical protein